MVSSQWCEKHWAIIRDDTSLNGIAASLLLMQAFLDAPGVAEEAGGKAANLNRVMARHAPVCCWLGEAKMREIYEASRMPDGGSLKHGEDRRQHDMRDAIKRGFLDGKHD